MNALTKVFVVLLVVCSMLLTAAVVVFVSKVDTTQAALTSANNKAAAADKRADAAMLDAAATKTTLARQAEMARGEAQAATQRIGELQTQLDGANVKIAQLTASNATQLANNAKLTAGLAAAQDTIKQDGTIIADARNSVDKLQRQALDDSRAIAELTNLRDTVTKELKWKTEQLAEAQDKYQKASLLLQNNGINVETAGTNGTPPPTPRINGLVKDKRQVDGVTYVTINVGTAEGVARGMQFNVVDRSKSDFLGVVTITSVDTNEATGRLEGPDQKVGLVQAGNEVKTELRGS